MKWSEHESDHGSSSPIVRLTRFLQAQRGSVTFYLMQLEWPHCAVNLQRQKIKTVSADSAGLPQPVLPTLADIADIPRRPSRKHCDSQCATASALQSKQVSPSADE
jgi:hypothetical protein